MFVTALHRSPTKKDKDNTPGHRHRDIEPQFGDAFAPQFPLHAAQRPREGHGVLRSHTLLPVETQYGRRAIKNVLSAAAQWGLSLGTRVPHCDVPQSLLYGRVLMHNFRILSPSLSTQLSMSSTPSMYI